MELSLVLKVVGVVTVGVMGYAVGSRSSSHAFSAEGQGDARRVSIASSGALDALLREADSRKRTKALAQFSLKLKAGEYEGFLNRIRKEAGFLTFHSIYLKVLEEWAAIDPKSALLYVSKLEESLMGDAIRVIVDCWMAVDEDAAIEWAKGLPERRFRGGVKAMILTWIGTKDIDRFISLLQEDDLRLAGLDDYSIVWNTWINRDPRALIESVTKRSSLSERNKIYHLIVEAWGVRDAKAALSWTQSLPPGDFRSSLVERALGYFCKLDPKEAIGIALRELSEGRRSRVFEVAMSDWIRTDRSGALAFVEQLPPGGFRMTAVSDTLLHLSNADPVAAAAWVDQNPSFSQMVPMVACLWEERDRAAAIAWVEKEADDGIRKNAMTGIFQSWGTNDPERAMQAVMDLPPGKVDDNLLGMILLSWTERDFAAGYRWLSRNQSKVSREDVGELVRSMAGDDLTSATALAELMPKGEGGDGGAFARLGEEWAIYAPTKGLEQLKKITESSDRERFLFGYVNRLADENPSAAWAVAQSQPEGELRDRLLKLLPYQHMGKK